MTIETVEDYTVPSDPETRRRIRERVKEMSDIMTMMDGQRDKMKDTVNAAKEELGVPKSIFKKMAKAFHKQEFSSMVHDAEVFELFYGNIMEDPTTN